MDMNDIWRFIAYYNGIENKDGNKYHKFDITTLFSMLNIEKTKAYIYFDEDLELSYIKLKYKSSNIKLYVVEPMEEKYFEESDFDVE
mmetsp:Transcript_17265/g.1540  ORF Transcript_17265/g.1540 Transcript_17265/m.1540 type:complete len:87 (+) Transcript_17265:410-670(+)